MSRPFFTAAFLIASLAACQAEGTEEPVTPEAGETISENVAVTQEQPDIEATPDLSSGEADDSGCGADKLARWLNALPTDDAKAQIAATVGERRIRYIGSGDAVTMDFSPARLNVELGEDGRIKLFRCG